MPLFVAEAALDTIVRAIPPGVSAVAAGIMTLAGVVGSLGLLYRKAREWLRPAVAAVHLIQREMRPNGGDSIKDVSKQSATDAAAARAAAAAAAAAAAEAHKAAADAREQSERNHDDLAKVASQVSDLRQGQKVTNRRIGEQGQAQELIVKEQRLQKTMLARLIGHEAAGNLQDSALAEESREYLSTVKPDPHADDEDDSTQWGPHDGDAALSPDDLGPDKPKT